MSVLTRATRRNIPEDAILELFLFTVVKSSDPGTGALSPSGMSQSFFFEPFGSLFSFDLLISLFTLDDVFEKRCTLG
jgi:hypothetical protein